MFDRLKVRIKLAPVRWLLCTSADFPMISLGDLSVLCVAVAIVAGFFLVARRFIRHAELGVAREDHPSDPSPPPRDPHPGH